MANLEQQIACGAARDSARGPGLMAKVKKAKAKLKTGRPSKYSSDLAAKICARIVEGQSLRQVCETAGMPSKTTVLRWLADERRAAFCHQYARAREAQADTFAGEVVEIADTEEDAQKARNRIDARKWAASKLRPKVYGDRVVQEHSGSVEITKIERVIVYPEV